MTATSKKEFIELINESKIPFFGFSTYKVHVSPLADTGIVDPLTEEIVNTLNKKFGLFANGEAATCQIGLGTRTDGRHEFHYIFDVINMAKRDFQKAVRNSFNDNGHPKPKEPAI